MTLSEYLFPPTHVHKWRDRLGHGNHSVHGSSMKPLYNFMPVGFTKKNVENCLPVAFVRIQTKTGASDVVGSCLFDWTVCAVDGFWNSHFRLLPKSLTPKAWETHRSLGKKTMLKRGWIINCRKDTNNVGAYQTQNPCLLTWRNKLVYIDVNRGKVPFSHISFVMNWW